MDWRGRLTDSDTQRDLCSCSTASEHGWDARARTHVHTKTHMHARAHTHSVLGYCSVQWHIFYSTHRLETHLPQRHTVRTGITHKHNDCSPTEFLLMHAIGNISKQNKMRHTYTHTLSCTHTVVWPLSTSQHQSMQSALRQNLLPTRRCVWEEKMC